MKRDMAGRYAFAEMLFNVSGLAPLETVESEGPGAPAVGSRPAPARTEGVHGAGAGHDAGDYLPGPSHFSRVAGRLAAQRRAAARRADASPLKPRVRRTTHSRASSGAGARFPTCLERHVLRLNRMAPR